jgi:glutamate N-acetyltransferase/amino-acid N-acetyltransferase
MLVATGKSGVEISSEGEQMERFNTVLREVCRELAQSIIRDGEGITKFITVRVEGGNDSRECLDVAYTIAHSPLVKTAFFASDPNWGRILAAVGRAGLSNLDIGSVDIYLNDVCIVEGGGRSASYTEEAGQAVMNQDEITIRVILNRGEIVETVWTTDLSHDYVKINAEYRT